MEGGAAVSTEKQNESTPSYTYWVRQKTQDAAPLPLPKKLTSGDLNNQANNTQTHLGSAWNRGRLEVEKLNLMDLGLEENQCKTVQEEKQWK
ncbi:hypothetical protein H5410_060603 [Solanum commersonii]|uniref:Uncharacterized protein n=1 Tax=Solanum commersonii TaxID=4109 RepID=A0A9J5W5I2_SOLCO|nr:hypothetical protein H5410_060603 [Solanum commersonii]